MALTPAQLLVVRNDIANSTDPAVIAARGNGADIGRDDTTLAALYNAASTFVIWRADVQADEIGGAWLGTDIDGMTSINMQRLQLLLASSASGVFDMTRADRRAGFENPFGTNVNNGSRVAMRAVWKRFASRVERLFATGTGSEATPGLLVFEGEISPSDIGRAFNPA